MVECLVEYEYVSQEEDELTIRPGDVISNVLKLEGGWWEGELNGKKGVFPDNFVKEIKQEVKKVPPESNHRASVKKVVGGGGGGHVAELANRLGKEGAIRIGPPAPGALKREQSQTKKHSRVKVTFSYNPENEDELRLEVGDVLTVTKQEEEGWWEGILRGKQGMFPSNFVEVLDEDGDASGEELNTPEGEVVEIHGKKVKGVGLGNIFSAGPIKLRSTGSKEAPSAVKRSPTSPKTQPAKEPVPLENSEKRDSLKRGTAPTEPPPSLPPKDPPAVVKPFMYSFEYASSATTPQEKTSSKSTGSSRGFSSGQNVVENGQVSQVSTGHDCTSPGSEYSVPELNIPSPASTGSGKRSDSSMSGKSDGASDDVPYELSALSQTRQTPPPKLTQFNFRKRRSRGTPKNSPQVNMVAINEVQDTTNANTSADVPKSEKPPKKVAKLQGNNAEEEECLENTSNNARRETTSTASQTDAQFVEDETTTNLTPRRVVIRAFARSKSEPCLVSSAVSKRSVSFVTRDEYVSDGEEVGEAQVFSDGARKRRSRGRFYTRGIIDAAKITDSLKLLRIKLGMNPEGPSGDEIEVTVEKEPPLETPTTQMKTRSKTLSRLIKKISASPIRGHNSRDKDVVDVGIDVANITQEVNFGEPGIRVTEDNCSTTAMKGSPLSSRSASMRDVVATVEETGKTGKEAKDAPSVQETPHRQRQHRWHFHPFGLPLGLRRNKIQGSKSHDVPVSEEKELANYNNLNEIRSAHIPEKSYFQTLDNMGMMSPAIKNISNKYKLFPMDRLRGRAEEMKESTNASTSMLTTSSLSRRMVQPSVSFQMEKAPQFYATANRPDEDENEALKLHAVPCQIDVRLNKKKITNPTVDDADETDLDENTVQPSLEEAAAAEVDVSRTYEPNEGDLNRPRIKRTPKSFNIAIDKNADVEPRKANLKRHSLPAGTKTPAKKPSFAQRIRRFWTSREKPSKKMDRSPDGESSEEGLSRKVGVRRSQLVTKSDTTASQIMVGKEDFKQTGNQILASRTVSAPIEPVSLHGESAPRESQAKAAENDSFNASQNNSSAPLDAIFRLQNIVHSFSPSDDSGLGEKSFATPKPVENVVPPIKRKNMSTSSGVRLSDSSANSSTVPDADVLDEAANLEFPVLKKVPGNLVPCAEKLGKGKAPRRVTPTPVAVRFESMHTEINDDVSKSASSKGSKRMQHSTPKVKISKKSKTDSAKHKKGKTKFTPMEMDEVEISGAGMDVSMKYVEKKPRWGRSYSAPPSQFSLEMRKRPSWSGSATVTHISDDSLDTWDTMKMLLDEAEAVYANELGGVAPRRLIDSAFCTCDESYIVEGPDGNDTSPRVECSEGESAYNSAGYRPFDHDESYSVEGSSTDSASEGRDMDTGDYKLEDEIRDMRHYTDDGLHSTSYEGEIQGTGNNTNEAAHYSSYEDEVYANAPASSPTDPRANPPNSTLSVSNLSDSLSRLSSSASPVGSTGSGEKRKQCDAVTPSKEEQQRGNKVRLESPESDEEGPPRARRVVHKT